MIQNTFFRKNFQDLERFKAEATSSTGYGLFDLFSFHFMVSVPKQKQRDQ